MSLAIVMPAYNEADCIEEVVYAWLKVLQRVPGFLLVVNDGSKDRTGEILNRIAISEPCLKVVHQANAGHGAAVLRAYREALKPGVTHVFQTDSDDQFKPEDFWQLWERREKSPFITGFRQARSDAFHRLVITRLVAALNLLFFGVKLKDSNIPFRLIRADFLKVLLQMLPDDVFAPNIFLTVLAAKAGSTLFELPIIHEERKTGQVSIIRWKLVKICLRCAGELLRFRQSLHAQRPQLESLKSRYVTSSHR
ncbi:MAG: glycosyltransferase family 2 protein [bacterium]